MIVLGIDPGVTGGIVFLHTEGISALPWLSVHDIPSALGEIDAAAVKREIEVHLPTLAVIERASSRPGQGVASTFKYGAAYGALKAIVSSMGIPLHVVTPQKWKKHFNLDSDKEKSRALAIRLWPSCPAFSRKMDHGRAEAALIAQYGREVLVAPVAEK